MDAINAILNVEGITVLLKFWPHGEIFFALFFPHALNTSDGWQGVYFFLGSLVCVWWEWVLSPKESIPSNTEHALGLSEEADHPVRSRWGKYESPACSSQAESDEGAAEANWQGAGHSGVHPLSEHISCWALAMFPSWPRGVGLCLEGWLPVGWEITNCVHSVSVWGKVWG